MNQESLKQIIQANYTQACKELEKHLEPLKILLHQQGLIKDGVMLAPLFIQVVLLVIVASVIYAGFGLGLVGCLVCTVLPAYYTYQSLRGLEITSLETKLQTKDDLLVYWLLFAAVMLPHFTFELWSNATYVLLTSAFLVSCYHKKLNIARFMIDYFQWAPNYFTARKAQRGQSQEAEVLKKTL